MTTQQRKGVIRLKKASFNILKLYPNQIMIKITVNYQFLFSKHKNTKGQMKKQSEKQSTNRLKQIVIYSSDTPGAKA